VGDLEQDLHRMAFGLDTRLHHATVREAADETYGCLWAPEGAVPAVATTFSSTSELMGSGEKNRSDRREDMSARNALLRFNSSCTESRVDESPACAPGAGGAPVSDTGAISFH
jgi:hypothetical protein